MNEQPLLKNSLNLIRLLWQHCSQRVCLVLGSESVRGGQIPNGVTDGLLSLPAASRSALLRLRQRPFVGSLLASLLLLLTAAGASAQSPQTDLMVDAAISNQMPALNSPVTYTVAVANQSDVAATNVKVKVTLPAGYVTATSFTASTGSSFTLASGDWSIASLPANTTATVRITATVVERGVAFLTAEVTAADQQDSDSVPHNGSYLEDDLDNVCFSVPLLLYAGEEYTVSAPAGFSAVKYYKGTKLVGGPDVPAEEASIDGDGNLVIKSTGTYSLAASLSGCQANNCCNIQVDPGPLAKVGDYVWLDTNKDGQQGHPTQEPPVPDVVVQLYQPGSTSVVSTTMTDGEGKYLFAGLLPGAYYVVFTAPAGFTYTNVNSTSPVSGTAATLVDSDANPATGQTQTFTLVGGQEKLSVDAGLLPLPASLGDYVFLDQNENGIQDGAETGVANVTVSLYKDGTKVASTTTSSGGLYSFTGLAAGQYTVAFTAPAGTTFTTPLAGTNTAIDSNVQSGTGQIGLTAVVSLSAGEHNKTIDAGLVPLKASLGDFVFLDNNDNGKQDLGESGLQNVTVTLMSNGSAVATQLTSASGAYLFTNLKAGSYKVVFTAPAGYTFTTANVGDDAIDSDVTSVSGQSGTTDVISLTAGEKNLTVDAGLKALPASLGDFVFLDKNENGIQDAGEPGVLGVRVRLLSNGTTVASTTTTANGAYSFDRLTAGTYQVVFTAPVGMTYTTPLAGTNTAFDSNVSSTTGNLGGTGLISLTVGQQNTTIDAGLILVKSSLGDLVFFDGNHNGQQDAGETGVQSVTVTLLSDGGAVATQVTSVSGTYLFDKLLPGDYSVRFTVPRGYTFTTANVGDDATDSDVTGGTGLVGTTGTYVLSAGEHNMTVDAGLQWLPASLGDYVFLDNNHNGVQDEGEPGVPNVTVTLHNTGTLVAADSEKRALLNKNAAKSSSTLVATTTTNADGLYSFTGLAPGNYQVFFTAPEGTTFTMPNATTNTAKDSNVNSMTGQLGSTPIVSLTAGEHNRTIDAGLVPQKATLGDYVWIDSNGDGQQGPAGTEPPVPGVRVQIYQVGMPTAVASTTTNTSGFYSFTGLMAGDYYVVFTAPAGTTFTMANEGNDATDSDVTSLTGQLGSTGIITLNAGEHNNTIDAGLLPLKGSLGNYVFLDSNHNGQQDEGEKGVENVVVTLLSHGMAVATQTTSVSGTYLFTNLEPGDYSVSFSTPRGYTFTMANVGNDATDSDVTSVAGLVGTTEVYSLTAGEQNLTVDAGLVPLPASLGDFVFRDNNANGIQDAGEQGIAHVSVSLYSTLDGLVSTTQTSASGFYEFKGLKAGDYYLVFTSPSGTTFTTPMAGPDRALDSDVTMVDEREGITEVVSLSAGEHNNTVDAGLVPLKASLGDLVFLDSNGNGQQDAGEPGVANVHVTLMFQGSALATRTTSASGTYLFTDLEAGDYKVIFATPQGYTFTTPNVGDDATDSDAADFIGQTGATGIISLTSGEHNLTVDAGMKLLPASVGDYVFLDRNGNGLQDTDEPGVPGVGVTLYGATDNQVVGTMKTNASGNYRFEGLQPGNYYVVFTAPAGVTFTTPLSGTNTAIDSNVLSATGSIGSTGIVSLTAGEYNATIDAGLMSLQATLGNYVFLDSNRNGIQDPGEQGVAGVKVTLYNADSNAVVEVQVTPASGLYEFKNLPAGRYYIVVETPASLSLTAQNSTTNTAIDSNPNPLTGRTNVITLVGGQVDNTVDVGVVLTCPSEPSSVTIVASSTTICEGTVASLTGTSRNGESIRWYLTALGNNDLIATTTSGQALTVQPSTTTAYYAEPVSSTATSCPVTRTAIAIVVTSKPPTPTCPERVTTCIGGHVNLTTVYQSSVTGSNVFEWHTGPETTSPVVTNITAAGPGKYYLFERSLNGCFSNPSILTVEGVDCGCRNPATIALGPGKSVCEGESIVLTATIGGGATSVSWTASGSGTLVTAGLSATYTPSASDIAGELVTITATTNDPDGAGLCTSASSNVLIDINKRPGTPVGVACDDELVCQGQSTKLIGFSAQGARINWYGPNNTFLGSTASAGKLTVTPTGTTVYSAEAISEDGCVSMERSSVTVVVGQCQADLAVTGTLTQAGNYSIGQTVTYQITACNNGPVTGENVTVSFPLPASVSYLSATPSTGTYNSATGVWTIGTLANGACRNLFVEVKIGASGTISATAVVTGTNNDPRKPENDVAVVTFPVTAIPCEVQPPHIACALTDICRGYSSTLTAIDCEGGQVLWSNGMTGASIRVTPNATTVYTANCVTTRCTSVASNSIVIRVNNPAAPVLTASANSVCVGATVSLTASGCESGTVLWSTGAVGSVISTVIKDRTTITANCRIASCLSPQAEIVIDLANELPKPTILCSTSVVCPGESIELTAQSCVGTPLWSTGETTPSITVRPTETSRTYFVTCTNGSCRSPQSENYVIRIVKPTVPVVTVSSGTVCANSSVTLTASGCAEGEIQWSNQAKGNTLVVSPTTNISYFAACKVRECISEPSAPVALVVVNPTPPSVRRPSKPIVCSGESVTLTADGCTAGTIVWSTGATGASIVVLPTETKTYSASCQIGNCRSAGSNSEQITVNTSTGPAPTVVSSKADACGTEPISLSATGCTSGTVVWSDGQMGNVITVTPTTLQNEFYAVCRQPSGCGSPRSNKIVVRINPAPAPTVVCSESLICPGESVELTVKGCVGTALWSTGENTPTITVRPAVTTGYSVTCQNGVCLSHGSQVYTIQVVQPAPPTVTASSTLVQPGASVTLTATCSVGTVQWMTNETTASIVVSVTGTQSYQAFCKFRACLSEASTAVTIMTTGPCQVAAGTLRTESGTICAGNTETVMIKAVPNGGQVVPDGYTLRYVLTKGTDLVIQNTNTTPEFVVPTEGATFRVHTLVYNATPGTPNYLDLSGVQLGVTKASEVAALIAEKQLCAALDATGVPVVVKIIAPPTISSPSMTVCAGSSVTLTAAGCENGTVTWSNNRTGQFIVVDPIIEPLWVMATCTIDGCTSKESASYDVDVIVPQPPTVTSDKPTICLGEQTTLVAVGCAGGGFRWESGETTASITVTPTASNHTYRVQCVYGGCLSNYSPEVKVNVNGPNAPTVSIEGSGTAVVTSLNTCFGEPVTLVATGCPAGAYTVWSNGEVGNRITVRPSRNVNYTAQCCTSNNCKSAVSNLLTVNVGPKVVVPTTKDISNACPFTTADLTTGVTTTPTTAGGVFDYFTSTTPSASDRVSNPGAVSRSGAYYVFEKTSGGCYSLGGVINVRISACEGQQLPCDKNPLTANAGRDDKICAAKSYKLSGAVTGTDTRVQWTTSGTGKFSDPFVTNPTYLPSLADLQAGKVTLKLSVTTPNATCAAVTDDMVLSIEGVKETPTIRAIGSLNLCAGDSVTLEATNGDTFKWSNRATGNRIVVKTSGTYTVQSFNAAGCSSFESEPVVVTVSQPLSAPLVANKRNTCPATTVDLTTALSETIANGTTYSFRMGPSPASGLVMRPDAVTDGVYYAFLTNSAGCVSAPAAIEVKTFNCATDSVKVDLAITKTASKTALNRGEVVTYTITVQNLSGKAATNVNVRDVLPAGLELVPAPGDFNVSNGAITKWWGVLGANASASISFQARLSRKGAVVNTAEITYADQQDPQLANNKSSVTVADTSVARPGMIGLAKALTSQKMLTDSTFEVEYAFRLTNYGDTELTNIQLVDDLQAVFGTHRIEQLAVATTDADNFKLTFNPAFLNGSTKTLISNGTLKPSTTTYFFLSATVKLDAANSNRTFSNTATATATTSGTMTTEDASVNGGDADPDGDGNPTNNASATTFTLTDSKAPVNPIGVALAVVSSVKQPDNSYNVTYKVTVKNFGDKQLTNVSLTDSLAKAFPSPAAFTVVSGPTTRSNSSLLANTNYDGITNLNLLLADSKLAAGEADTVLVTVNVTPNGSNGPFYSSVLGGGVVASTSLTVSDLSNNGTDPAPAGSQKTPVRFDLPAALLGVAKSVGTPQLVEEGIFDVPYTIKVSNLGTADLTKVQVIDNLSNTFNRGALILSNRIKATAQAGLTADSLYTGQGMLTKLLVDSLSTLPRGTSRSLSFTVRVNVKNADSLTFYNSAVATAQAAGGVMVADTSTAGTNPDPKNNLDPRTSNEPTPVVLNNVPNKSYIGLALAVKDTVMKEDGSYNVTFQLVVKNYGSVGMTNVTITDTLSKVFNELNGSSFKVVGTPIASKTSELAVNTGFNGSTDVRLVVPERSVLGAGKTDTLTFTVNVKSNGLTTTFLNTAYASGLANTVKVTDVSTSGLNPDVNGNRNPTDSMEGEATQVFIRVTDSAVFIPEGFSPNGDNINDLFVIRGTLAQKVAFEVYNRWGQLVYKSEDYKNDWNGTSNTGVRVNNTGALPDGTYFYRVRLENGRTYVRYMTINR